MHFFDALLTAAVYARSQAFPAMLRLDQVTIFDDKTRLPSQRRPTRDCSTAFMHNYDFVILAMQVRSDASGIPHTIPT